jgi:signal transduction histidine kinase
MTLRLAGLRARLMIAVVVAVVVGLGAVIAAFNVILDSRLDQQATDLARARATAERLELDVVNGRLVVDETPDETSLDREVWVFAGRRVLEGPRTTPSIDGAARSLVGGPGTRLDLPGQHLRLLAVPVVQRGRRMGTVVAAVSLAPYERTRELTLAASLILGGLLLLAVIGVTGWVLSAALRPVARMTSAAAEWSEHDLDRRFRLGSPRDELTQLAATLDGMLDRLAASLRREQRVSAEISHEMRTPLARVSAEAQLALRSLDDRDPDRAPFERILSAAEEMARTLDVLMAAARAAAQPQIVSADPYRTALAAAETATELASARGVRIDVRPPGAGIRVGADAEVVERILHPLLENACRHARSRVSIAVSSQQHDRVEVLVEDDGPGVEPAERESIFEPGVRGRSPAKGGVGGSGAGLGLSLARRLAATAGGQVEARSGPGGRFAVSLPAA